MNMKKTLISIIGILIFCSNIFSQTVYLTTSLQAVIKNKSAEATIPILIVLNKQLNYLELKQSFDNQNLTEDQRALKTLELLHEQQTTNQKQFINDLESYKFENNLKIKHCYWICNMILAEANVEVINQLSTNQNIRYLEYADNKIILEGETKESEITKAVNGTEPGLVAINAPAMWALGYTGKGRVVYNYDTGVWSTHPAFSNRFLANFFPVSQCWYGYYSEIPTGAYNSHGTHTLGTMIGLDTLKHDTIGIAFNAYWIANDLVRGSVAELPPISDMVLAFEWALDPDQNPATVYDIPDVINNSWRWYDGNDLNYCNDFVVDMLQSLSLAGIATLFSGGNSGPANQTVNSPQRTKINLVNSFCVGAIDANTINFPIANFSTHGPSQCTSDIALNIHPEVVAPGVNIRSAYGQEGYSSLNGTSMSCPHVSGAILLLKEAFPNLTGEQLLEALYYSAVDLGEVGEDNIYGRGLIDVYAAYQYLCQTHTPVLPQYNYDLAINKVYYTNCPQNLKPFVEVINKGELTVSDFNVDFFVDNVFIENVVWNGNLNKNEKTNVSFAPYLFANEGLHKFSFKVKNNNIASEVDSFNNKLILNYEYYTPEIPFFQGFEDGVLNSCWIQEKLGSNSLWYCKNGGAVGTPATAFAGNYNLTISGDKSTKTRIILPEFNLSSFTNPYLNFEYTLPAQFGAVDTLSIYYRISLTGEWTLFKVLSTVATNWTQAYLSLPNFSDTYYLCFEANLNGGRGISIDDISIDEFNNIETTNKIINTYTLFPNPCNDILTISSKNNNTENLNITIKDVTGKEVLNNKINFLNKTDINISELRNGIYFINIENQEMNYVNKLIKY